MSALAVCALLLALVVDSSNSVDDAEYRQQVVGTADALMSEEVGRIVRNMDGGMAVTVIQFTEYSRVVIDWRMVRNDAERDALARDISKMPRIPGLFTSISAGLEVAIQQMANPPCEGMRMTIDVSADGVNNSGRPPEEFRNIAQGAGIQINGLVVVDRNPTSGFSPDLVEYFQNSIITSGGHTDDGNYVFPGFVMAANGYEEYGRAMLMKLQREISEGLGRDYGSLR